jgi:hypothetical protein
MASTHSRTLWLCRGCRYGLFVLGAPVGVVPSDTEGKVMAGRALVVVGLKSPGDEIGVLLAVRRGAGDCC